MSYSLSSIFVNFNPLISYPFRVLVQDRVYPAKEYRFGFNGKEKDDEVSRTGNQYDYGFRIYIPRLGKFLSVDPLTKSYPWYTPFQFAGNKPIQAVDMDGLEEKIVIYENTSNGKVRTTTLNSIDLIKTSQISGSIASNKSISKNEFENTKKLYFEGFRLAPGLFVSGFKEYTQAQAPDNSTTGFIGPKYGTLTIGVGPNGNAISYDPTPVQEEQESIAEIINRNTFKNPDYRQKKFNSTVTNYVAGVSAPITTGLVLQYGGIVSGIGGSASLVNTADDLTSELTGQTPIKLTLGEQNGAAFKTGLSALSVIGNIPSFGDAPLRSTITTASDVLGGAINTNQCFNYGDSTK